MDLLAVVVLLVFVLALVAAVFVSGARPARWDSTRARLVAALDGRLVDGGATVVCTLGGVEVTIRPAPGRRGGELMATVGCPTRGVVRAPTLLGWMWSPAGPVTGDDAFDRWVDLRGPELEAVAPLDAAARAAILRGVHAGVRFERGTASLEIPASGGEVAPVLGQLRLLVDASVPWREAEVGVRSRLVALADGDPERMVRAWAVLRLSRLPGDAAPLALRLATQSGLALMDALASPHPDEVTGAAVWFGLRGGVDAIPALRALRPAELALPARLAVAEAVLAIQARVAPGAAGSLARVEGDGDLSLALVDELAVVRRDASAEDP